MGWRGTWALDGGVVANQASHHIDMLEWLMGQVESVMAMTQTRLADIEAEDTAIALLRFTSGALGIIEATTATRPKDLEGSISILGETGSVEIGGFFMNQLKTWQFTEPVPEDESIMESHGQNPDLFRLEPHRISARRGQRRQAGRPGSGGGVGGPPFPGVDHGHL